MCIVTMKIVQTWQPNDLSDKEIRSCDNKDVGHAKAGDGPFLLSVKAMRTFQIPREAIATFDGDKVYLRATEAEIQAGVYPFIGEHDGNGEYQSENMVPPRISPSNAV